ncbi:unnamed protein product [Durusdinium trenchii]|uniref:Uncharacterized protein n=1 Tax=Durusdinium trenchii TaxID=1381693 RepID=A0ABP0I6U9_9DINO
MRAYLYLLCPSLLEAWRLACVVKLGNSTADLHGFHSIYRTWGSHCEWLVAVIPSGARATFWTTVGQGSFQVIQLVDPPSDARDLLQLTRLTIDTISGGLADLVCALARPWMFLVPQNLIAFLSDQQTASGELGHWSIPCGKTLFCQTGLPQVSQVSMRAWPLFPAMCGRRLEEACGQNLSQPVALHASSTRQLSELHAFFYHAWPLKANCQLRLASSARPPLPRVAVLIGSLLRGLHKSGQMLRRLFKDRRIRYHIFMYSSPPLAWGNNLGCARLLDDLVHQLPRHQITWRYATRSENLQEEAFAKRVNSRWGSCAGALKPLMKQLD